MKLSIYLTEFKILVRCITALSRFGQEISFDWGKDSLVLKTVNSSRTAYASIAFKLIFFAKFEGSDQPQPFRFKIPGRSCCSVFKLSSSLEKTLQKCRLIMPPTGDLLVVQYFCKHGIVKTFNMTVMDGEYLEAAHAVEESANHLVLPTKILGEILGNFRQSTEELTLFLKEGECTFQNYIPPGESSSILTQIPLSASEFDSYLVGRPSELTFCQKELRALLTFCDLVSPVLRIYCDCPGHPIIFACSHETRLSSLFILATIPIDSSSQGSQSQRSYPLVSKTPVRLKKSFNCPDSVSISMTSHLVLPDVPEGHSTATLRPSNPPYRQPIQPSPVPTPSTSSRPLNVPHIRPSVPSSVATTNGPGTVEAPPTKKARSLLFSHLEESQDSDAESDAMDLELLRMTKRYDTSATRWTSCGLTSHNATSTTTPSRTVLVADSDEEDR